MQNYPNLMQFFEIAPKVIFPAPFKKIGANNVP